MRAVQPCVCISCCCCWLHGAAPCSRQPEGTEPEPSEPRAPAGCSVAAPRLRRPPGASRDRHEKQHGGPQVSGKHRHHWCVLCPLDGSEGVRAAAGSGCKNFLFFSVAQALGLLRGRMHQAKGRLCSPSAGSRCPLLLSPPPCPGAHPGSGRRGRSRPSLSPRAARGRARVLPSTPRPGSQLQPPASARARLGVESAGGGTTRLTRERKGRGEALLPLPSPYSHACAAGGGGLGPGWVAEAGGEDGTSHL